MRRGRKQIQHKNQLNPLLHWSWSIAYGNINHKEYGPEVKDTKVLAKIIQEIKIKAAIDYKLIPSVIPEVRGLERHLIKKKIYSVYEIVVDA